MNRSMNIYEFSKNKCISGLVEHVLSIKRDQSIERTFFPTNELHACVN